VTLQASHKELGSWPLASNKLHHRLLTVYTCKQQSSVNTRYGYLHTV